MDSVVHAEDSSSASANLQITILKREWASTGILKVYPEEGPSFFVRVRYLPLSCAEALEGMAEIVPASAVLLSDVDSAALYGAARTFLAERVALDYLARAEHCRYQLSIKLRHKGYSSEETDRALDYLESGGELDDRRFAEAWLRNRAIHQCEGRMKLYGGLVSRGIGSKIAAAAIDEYFSGIDEKELCEKALGKLLRTGKSGDTLKMALARKGFSRNIIENSIKKR